MTKWKIMDKYWCIKCPKCMSGKKCVHMFFSIMVWVRKCDNIHIGLTRMNVQIYCFGTRISIKYAIPFLQKVTLVLFACLPCLQKGTLEAGQSFCTCLQKVTLVLFACLHFGSSRLSWVELIKSVIIFVTHTQEFWVETIYSWVELNKIRYNFHNALREF